MTENLKPYDALLICSFGGPNIADDVVPFLQNVTRGKDIPVERLKEVGEHYYGFGGKSPINEQNLDLLAALKTELANRGINLPVIWGNRNWHPYTVDTLRDASAFGAKRVLTIVTSAYNSYSGSRQYREHLAAAVEALGNSAPEIDILRAYFNNPGFVQANYERIKDALAEIDGNPTDTHIVYVTHSIPNTMQDASEVTGAGYKQQHEDVMSVINERLAADFGGEFKNALTYCSRSGDPRVPWLEPDVNDYLEELAGAGVEKVIIAPIGFVSDHMEVAFDLDIEAMNTAKDLEITAARAGTAGVHPAFVAGLVDMIVERAARESGENPEIVTVGSLPAFGDTEPAGSCRMRHNEVTGIPVIAGSED